MNDIQIFGYILFISGLIVIALVGFRSMTDRFEKYLEEVRLAGRLELENISREVSELTLRDKHGKMFTVKIIVDHNLNPEVTPNELKELVSNQEAGSLSDMLNDEAKVSPQVGEVKEFVFSIDAVNNMRQAGLEPDAVVVKMLRASGKIA